MRKILRPVLIAPALMGLALTASVAVTSPGSALASSSCQDLAWAYYYHYYQGNTGYAGQLLEWYNDAGC
jgi:hypothetical protein